METPRNLTPRATPAQAAALPRRPVGWLVAVMLAASAAFLVLRVVNPGDGTHVPPRTWAWTGPGVSVDAPPGRALRHLDLVTAIDGARLGGAARGWRVPVYQPGDRLTYQVVRGGRAREVTVTLGRADIAGPLLQAWGTILFVVALFGVVAYLYARRPGPATAALLVLGSGLLSSTVALEVGVSAVDARGGLVLWLYLFDTQAVYVAGWAGLTAFVVLFPRPWSPLARRRWLLPVVYATPPALLAAWALAAFGGVSFTRWVGRVIAAEALIVVAVLAVGIGLAVVRYRTTTDPVGRQQLKWLAGGGCVSATLALAVWFLPQLMIGRSLLPDEWLGFSGLPLVAGMTVAVLRHRLFDLARIVSRTVAYALLTVLLGGACAGIVLGLGQLLGRDRSNLAVAAATLAVAAGFSRPAAASRARWTTASTATATTRPGRSRRSAAGCGRRSTWTRCAPSCWPW
jgi:two-component system NarL family sensor kinase